MIGRKGDAVPAGRTGLIVTDDCARTFRDGCLKSQIRIHGRNFEKIPRFRVPLEQSIHLRPQLLVPTASLLQEVDSVLGTAISIAWLKICSAFFLGTISSYSRL